MNTHINHMTGLVPGLKVKVPQVPRKEEPTVDQHIQKYYPNLDTEPAHTHVSTTTEAVAKPQPKVEPVVVGGEVEEVIPVPLKPMPEVNAPYGKPNDTVVAKSKTTNKSMEEYLIYMNQVEYKWKAIQSSYPQFDYHPGGCGGYSGHPTYMSPIPHAPLAMRNDPRLFVGGLGVGGLGGYGGMGGFGYPLGFGYGYGYPMYGGYGYPYGGWYGGGYGGYGPYYR